MAEGNYKFQTGFEPDDLGPARIHLFGEWGIRMIQGSMVLIPNLRFVGIEGFGKFRPRLIQPQLLHGPISLSREGISYYRDNFPRHTQRDTRTVSER